MKHYLLQVIPSHLMVMLIISNASLVTQKKTVLDQFALCSAIFYMKHNIPNWKIIFTKNWLIIFIILSLSFSNIFTSQLLNLCSKFKTYLFELHIYWKLKLIGCFFNIKLFYLLSTKFHPIRLLKYCSFIPKTFVLSWKLILTCNTFNRGMYLIFIMKQQGTTEENENRNKNKTIYCVWYMQYWIWTYLYAIRKQTKKMWKGASK